MRNPYSTQYTNLQDLLSGAGYDMSALQDPGSLYGFGQDTQYGQFFRPFDVSGFNQAQQSLKELEQNLLSNVGQKFSQATSNLQAQIGVTMDDITGQESKSGFGASGASQRRRELAYETGQDKFAEQKRQTQSQYTSVQEQIGTRAGQLEGTLFDFLGGAASTALQLQGFDPTGGAKLATEEDVQNFMSQVSGLNSNDMQRMLNELRGFIGKPYQAMLDFYKDYTNQQGGGMYG